MQGPRGGALAPRVRDRLAQLLPGPLRKKLLREEQPLPKVGLERRTSLQAGGEVSAQIGDRYLVDPGNETDPRVPSDGVQKRCKKERPPAIVASAEFRFHRNEVPSLVAKLVSKLARDAFDKGIRRKLAE